MRKLTAKRIGVLIVLIILIILQIKAFTDSRAKKITDITAKIIDESGILSDEIYMLKAVNEEENGTSIILPTVVNEKIIEKYIIEIKTINEEGNIEEENIEQKATTEEIENTQTDIENTEEVIEEVEEEKTEITENTEKNDETTEVTSEATVETETSEEIEKTETNISNEKEENKTNKNLKTEEKYPGQKIYLTKQELENAQVELKAVYEKKEKNEQLLYNKVLEEHTEEHKITVTGYMPSEAKLSITEVDAEEAQQAIRKGAQKPVILAVAYDIKIQVGDKIYEPYEVDENIKVKITKEELENKEINVWHIKNDEQVEQIEVKESREDTIIFETDEFSIYGLEDVQATALAIESMTSNVFTIDDAEADKNYWIGKNFTDDISGVNTNKYNDSNLANVTINYYGYTQNEVDQEMIGWVSLTERYNILTYKKICPITNGKVSVELIENPFSDRPTGYGFGGWTSSNGTITKDSNTNIQTITATASKNMTIDIYANWETAVVVYVNGDTGNDNVNNGLTPESPFGSWGKAISYLKSTSSNRNDREKNIIVMTGNMNTSINYTTPKTYKNGYISSNTFTPGETYIISNSSTGAGGNAFTAYDETKSNTVLSESQEPPLAAQWKIEASGNGYTLQNCYTGLYFSFVPEIPGCTEEPYIWLYDTNKRAFYVDDNGTYRYIGWYTSGGNNMWTTAPASYVGSSYFLKYSPTNTTGRTTSNSNYTSSSNIAFTLTSLYNHTDYRNNAKLTLDTNGSYIHFTMYNDFQMEYININASGYTSYATDSMTDTSYPVLYGNANNVRLGRGMYPISNTNSSAVTFVDVYGGSTSTTIGSLYNDNNAFRLSVETGKYSSVHPFNAYRFKCILWNDILSIW